MPVDVVRVVEQPGDAPSEDAFASVGLVMDEDRENALREALEQIDALEKEADTRVALVQLR